MGKRRLSARAFPPHQTFSSAFPLPAPFGRCPIACSSSCVGRLPLFPGPLLARRMVGGFGIFTSPAGRKQTFPKESVAILGWFLPSTPVLGKTGIAEALSYVQLIDVMGEYLREMSAIIISSTSLSGGWGWGAGRGSMAAIACTCAGLLCARISAGLPMFLRQTVCGQVAWPCFKQASECLYSLVCVAGAFGTLAAPYAPLPCGSRHGFHCSVFSATPYNTCYHSSGSKRLQEVCLELDLPSAHAAGGTIDKFIGDAIMAFW